MACIFMACTVTACIDSQHSYGLYSYGRQSYGLYSYGPMATLTSASASARCAERWSTRAQYSSAASVVMTSATSGTTSVRCRVPDGCGPGCRVPDGCGPGCRVPDGAPTARYVLAHLYRYGRCSYGLHSYGLHSYGLHSYGLCSYGLYRHGLYRYVLAHCGSGVPSVSSQTSKSWHRPGSHSCQYE